ncbi:MAG: nucleoside monophosphate kinase [Verrucomicrobiota bacterium]
MTAPAARTLRVVLLGPPASGKGTQGRRLAAALGLGYLSTGALLREQMEEGTALGRQAEPILARGEYLPDDLMCPILADWLSRQTGGWVLDGFPRSLPQALFLDEWLARRALKIDAAVSLEVPYPELVARIEDRVECVECRWTGRSGALASGSRCPSCGGSAGRRADDSLENFRSRHAEFVSQTQPVIEHYRRLDLVSPCDATAPQDEVASLLLEKFISQSLL